jgi:putative zinc finger/helix-turn-helix YgiT family protein
MKSPITGKEMKRMEKEDSLVFRKEEFSILYHYYLCEDSGEEFTDEILDNLNVVQAYNQYRTRYNLPFPDEIREIREQYDVSAAKMAEILGFGANVYRHYENGEVPSLSNARLIQLAKDPTEFKKLVQASNVLSGNGLEKVEKKIDELIVCQNDFRVAGLPQYLMTGLFNGRASIYTGYRTPSLKRMIGMIVYFTELCKPWKTKMNKLLFYADFFHYKRTGFSISGAEYMAIQMGPVPLNFGSIFEYAAMRDDINVTYQEFQNGGIGELFTPHPKHPFDASIFDAEELISMERIASQFKNASTADIVKFSHEEPAWSDNFNEKKKISYSYAFKLMYA